MRGKGRARAVIMMTQTEARTRGRRILVETVVIGGGMTKTGTETRTGGEIRAETEPRRNVGTTTTGIETGIENARNGIPVVNGIGKETGNDAVKSDGESAYISPALDQR